MKMAHSSKNEEVVLGKARTPAEYAGLVARGFLMGSADVGPGVSGGTMAILYFLPGGAIRFEPRPG